MSPRHVRLADETGGRPVSPISVVSGDAPSPLPRIVADSIGPHFTSDVAPFAGLTGPGGLGPYSSTSPGVESTREYSESDEEAPDTPGDLRGERLIP